MDTETVRLTSADIRWHDGPDDYFLADPAGGGEWVKGESDGC